MGGEQQWTTTRILKAIALGVFFWALRRILRVAFGLPATPPKRQPQQAGPAAGEKKQA